MMNLISVSQTSTGWKDEIEYPCNFAIPGMSRGFNIEYKMPDGRIDYSSCNFVKGEIDEMNPIVICDMDMVEYASGGVPTGNAVFRGYYYEMYDQWGGTYYEEVPLSFFDGFSVSVEN